MLILKNVFKKNNYFLSVFILLLLFFSLFNICYAKDSSEDGWESFGKWYEWKKNTKLPLEQKEVVKYFEKAGKIIDKIQSIYMEGPATMHPKPSPEKAIKLIDRYSNEFEFLLVPAKCKTHYDAVLNYIQIIRKFEEAAKKYGIDNEEALKVVRESLKYESIIFTEYWRVLREIGLFDNFEEESIHFGLLDTKELEKEYGFYRKFEIGIPVVCPDCGRQMRRVKILYEDDPDYSQAIKNNQKNYLFGEERFEGCPIYGYICDECNKWYEEYPAKDNNAIIIRNWCWGWHELVYKKQNR